MSNQNVFGRLPATEFDRQMEYLDKAVNDLIAFRRTDLAQRAGKRRGDFYLEHFTNPGSLEGSAKQLVPLTDQQVAGNIKPSSLPGTIPPPPAP